MSLTSVLDLCEARRKVHVPIESPTVGRGVADYLRGVTDEMLERCCRGGIVPPETAMAAQAEQEIRKQRKAEAANISLMEQVPTRIVRKRTKGWRQPAGAKYVGRPGKYGNPFNWQKMQGSTEYRGKTDAEVKGAAVARFRVWAEQMLARDPNWLAPLKGHDLACWCKKEEPCHVDVLLELANR